MTPEIAIVDSNTLSCLGLQNLLEEIIPTAIIRSFRSFGELMDDTPDMYVHYFISSQIYFEHTAFFLERKPKTIVLVNGETVPQLSGMPTLNIYQDEQNLAKNILQLRQYGNQYRQNHGKSAPARHSDMAINTAAGHDLSAREIEVLVLITKGLINKEIADKLNISLTTVISHRKNITEKLGIKSVSGLTIYAVMHGYVEADIFTLESAANPEQVAVFLRQEFAPDQAKITTLKRGDYGSIKDMKPRRQKLVKPMRRAKNAGAKLKKFMTWKNTKE